jgi:hypothetical protein
MSGSTVSSIARIGLIVAGNYFAPGIGGVLGGLAGNLLFPQKLPGTEGPRIDAAPVTSATQGIAIPVVWGTINVAGNIIWDGGFVEHKETQKYGGKGAPKQTAVSYTYTRSYAVGLCEGEIDGLIRAWRNGKLVYDVRSQQDGESDEDYQTRAAISEGFAEGFVLYLGTETQDPDPTIESYEGDGEVPANRGLAYIVFVDEDVTDNGARPSQWMFEVARSGTFSDEPIAEYSNEVLYEWERSTSPMSCRNNHRFRRVDVYGNSSVGTWRNTLAEALADSETYHGRPNSTLIGWRPAVAGASQRVYPHDSSVSFNDAADPPNSVTTLNLHYTDESPSLFVSTSTGENTCSSLGLVVGGPDIWWNGYQPDGDLQSSPGVWRMVTTATTNPAGWTTNNTCGGVNKTIHINDMVIEVERVVRAPDNPCEPSCTAAYPLLPENPNFCVIDGTLTRNVGYSLDSGTYKVLQAHTESGQYVTSYPLGPARPIGHQEYNSQAFWESAYDAAVDAGTMPAGLTYGVDYPVSQAYGYQRDYDLPLGEGTPIPLSTVVAELCERATLDSSQYDVSELTELVLGTKIESVMTARDAIDPLRSYGFFDCVDSGSFLNFPLRGKDPVATLDADDLGAVAGGSDEPQPLVRTTRAEDVELPRMVRVSYLQPNVDYATGQQKDSRLITTTVGAMDVQLVIAMTDDKAAQIAQVLLAEAWVGRETYRYSASPSWLSLEPGDVTNLPVEGETQRARITSITHGQVLEIEAVRDEPTVYESEATGAGTTQTGQTIGYAGVTVAIYIDGPALSSSDNDAGIYVAAYGSGNRWRGATIYQSSDGGSNYTAIGEVTTDATVGTLTTALPASGNWFTFDRTSTVRVTMTNGELESVSEDAVLNGANAAFVGAEGRWELIQFTTATLVSEGIYDISGLLRGRKGTEWAMGSSEVGDSFVLAGTVVRVPFDTSAIGVERLLKAPTFGTLLESAQSTEFTPAGVALEPYAPFRVTGQTETNSDITIGWIRRTRLSGEWLDGADVPLNEQSASFSIDVLDSEGEVVRTLTATTNRVTYTAAMQIADFGSTQSSVDVEVYQLSAIVGRGYVGCGCSE